jgi:hypothetical protein
MEVGYIYTNWCQFQTMLHFTNQGLSNIQAVGMFRLKRLQELPHETTARRSGLINQILCWRKYSAVKNMYRIPEILFRHTKHCDAQEKPKEKQFS